MRFVKTVGLLVIAAAAACSPAAAPETGGDQTRLSGLIKVDGSSTVFPITEAVAEEFQRMHRDVKVTVGISGTGGGFQKFCAGETDISDASRAISASEREACQKNNIEYIELPVAYDGLSVMVNPQNSFVTCMTVAELKKMWEPDAQGKVTKWSQIRPDWPDQAFKLYGAGTDSGTFDYFTQAINGKEKSSRGDFTPSEDDNVLVQGIGGDRNALGYFGYAYYVENKAKLKLVAIDEKGDGKCIGPADDTIQTFSYYLSRPIFIYVRTASMDRPEVKEFVKSYLQNAGELVKQVGYIPFTPNIYEKGLARFENRVTGTAYTTGVTAKTPLDQVYK